MEFDHPCVGLALEKRVDRVEHSSFENIQLTKTCKNGCSPGQKREYGISGSLQQKAKMLFGHSRKNGKKASQPRKHYKERFISLRVIPE